jgi:hypothetical protein
VTADCTADVVDAADAEQSPALSFKAFEAWFAQRLAAGQPPAAATAANEDDAEQSPALLFEAFEALFAQRLAAEATAPAAAAAAAEGSDQPMSNQW